MAAFAGSRLLVLFAEPMALRRIDEMYSGAAALELAGGRGLPLAQLAWDPYSGGSLVVIALARVFFALLGPSLLALKCVSLAFSLGTFVLWLLAMRSWFGARAMRVTALLFVFAPPEWTKLNLMAWGNHGESALPAAAALVALAHLDGRRPGELRRRSAQSPGRCSSTGEPRSARRCECRPSVGESG